MPSGQWSEQVRERDRPDIERETETERKGE